ncbi:hypothetical protein EYF80_000648 [Liparis tanakae]|uniref:Uncharacterized protein n=1 Tax=Liparis tanakae TaxID=230148 RepID=A0A4Z2JGS9_9TELE|nr:hypothetical protein EYF80_000648 [Liparis tanakae]
MRQLGLDLSGIPSLVHRPSIKARLRFTSKEQISHSDTSTSSKPFTTCRRFSAWPSGVLDGPSLPLE